MICLHARREKKIKPITKRQPSIKNNHNLVLTTIREPYHVGGKNVTDYRKLQKNIQCIIGYLRESRNNFE